MGAAGAKSVSTRPERHPAPASCPDWWLTTVCRHRHRVAGSGRLLPGAPDGAGVSTWSTAAARSVGGVSRAGTRRRTSDALGAPRAHRSAPSVLPPLVVDIYRRRAACVGEAQECASYDQLVIRRVSQRSLTACRWPRSPALLQTRFALHVTPVPGAARSRSATLASRQALVDGSAPDGCCRVLHGVLRVAEHLDHAGSRPG